MPQPIDMQSELGRTMAAERIQDAAARAALLAQQRSQIDAEQQRAAQEHVVAESHETENEGVDEDGKGGSTAEQERRKARAAAEQAKRPPTRAPGEGHTFDVSI